MKTIPEDHPRRVVLPPTVDAGDALASRAGRLRRWSRRVAPAALIAAAALTINPGLWAQTKIEAAVNGGASFTLGPTAVVAGADGVIAAGARIAPANNNNFLVGTTGEDYEVSQAAGAVAAANAQETPLMQKVADAVDKTAGKGGAALKAAKKQVDAAVNANIVTAKGQFATNAKAGLTSVAALWDPRARPYVVATGTQQVPQKGVASLGTNVQFRPNPLAAALPKGATSSGFVVNRDPAAVEWGSGAHTVTFNLGQLQLFAGPTSGDSVGAAAGVMGSFAKGTQDLTTAEPSTPNLFSLSLAVSGTDGTPLSTALDFSDLTAPQDPGYAISDSLGATTLAQVQADLLAQFDAIRTDPATGQAYHGFDSDFSVTVGVTGQDPDSVLFLDDYGTATIAAAPEPSTLIQVLAALLCGRGILLRRRRNARVGK